MDILPKPNSRSILAGKTNCGKTTLAKKLLEAMWNSGEYSSLVILDPKGTFKANGQIVRTYSELEEAQTKPVIIVRLDEELSEGEEVEEYNRILRWIYKRGNTLVYIDELFGVCPSALMYPKYLKALYTRGRELGITILAATQRPSGIPKCTYTEVEYFYCFALKDINDRKRMAEMMGDKVLTKATDHNFWYYDDHNDVEPIYTRINL